MRANETHENKYINRLSMRHITVTKLLLRNTNEILLFQTKKKIS